MDIFSVGLRHPRIIHKNNEPYAVIITEGSLYPYKPEELDTFTKRVVDLLNQSEADAYAATIP